MDQISTAQQLVRMPPQPAAGSNIASRSSWFELMHALMHSLCQPAHQRTKTGASSYPVHHLTPIPTYPPTRLSPPACIVRTVATQPTGTSVRWQGVSRGHSLTRDLAKMSEAAWVLCMMTIAISCQTPAVTRRHTRGHCCCTIISESRHPFRSLYLPVDEGIPVIAVHRSDIDVYTIFNFK